MSQHTEAVPADEPGTPGLWALAVVELYTVMSYATAAVVPYLWQGRQPPPSWLWAVPAWLFGGPGYWITKLGPLLGIPLALIGLGAWQGSRHALSARQRRWLAGAAALTTGYAAWVCTPLGFQIWAFVAR